MPIVWEDVMLTVLVKLMQIKAIVLNYYTAQIVSQHLILRFFKGSVSKKELKLLKATVFFRT